MFRIVILGSGTGSNARALLKAEERGDLGKGVITAVFSDVQDAPILKHRPAISSYLHPGAFRTKLDGEGQQRYIDTIQQQSVDLIVLAGFMRVIKPPFLEKFSGKVINLHPSLLPSFPGLDGIGQAFRAGVKITGCTVHWVTPKIDAGPILDQETVRIERVDTVKTLAQKVHRAEHQLLVRVVHNIANPSLNT